MCRAPLARAAAGVALSLFASSLAAAQAPASVEPSLDSLLGTRISAAAKYAQTSAQAPASVTIVTADDIRVHGYRDLHELLESVRGLYVSSDRSYPYLGTRGFGRPTDFNNRILLLVDGHTLNDQTWGGAPVGSDLPIDLAAVERVEVIRGPGSALYGSNAMFAVVNIVTKSGVALDGVLAAARAGSGGQREATLAAGRALGTRGAVAVSGLVARADGRDLHFPEYDDAETGPGVVRELDWEERVGGLAALQLDGVTARVGYRSRAKGIPTGAYEMAFGDPRAETVDASLWGELAARRTFGPAVQLTTRLYADRYRYRGVYPVDAGAPYTDGGGSTHGGVESMLTWDPTSGHRVVVGAELRRAWRAEYYEQDVDGSVTRDDAPFHVLSLYVHDELQLRRWLTLVSGLRLDEHSRAESALSPRVALIAAPDARTTAKLLYGHAFRAPTAAEAYLTTVYYTENPRLEPERIRTLELELQRRLAEPLLVTVSLYDYHIRGLIDQAGLDERAALVFRNLAESHGRGVELQVDVRPRGPLSAHVTYAAQNTHDQSSHQRLTNSPAHVATATAVARGQGGLRIAATVRHESARRTIAGPSTAPFTRTDVTLGYAPAAVRPAWARGLDLSLRVSNLFDVPYAVPAGLEHRQAAIAQDGRSLSLRLEWRR